MTTVIHDAGLDSVVSLPRDTLIVCVHRQRANLFEKTCLDQGVSESPPNKSLYPTATCLSEGLPSSRLPLALIDSVLFPWSISFFAAAALEYATSHPHTLVLLAFVDVPLFVSTKSKLLHRQVCFHSSSTFQVSSEQSSWFSLRSADENPTPTSALPCRVHGCVCVRARKTASMRTAYLIGKLSEI